MYWFWWFLLPATTILCQCCITEFDCTDSVSIALHLSICDVAYANLLDILLTSHLCAAIVKYCYRSISANFAPKFIVFRYRLLYETMTNLIMRRIDDIIIRVPFMPFLDKHGFTIIFSQPTSATVRLCF